MSNFTERLKFLRSRKGITQQELADAVGVSRTAITGYERLNKQPSFDLLIKIAEYFNVTTDYLLGKSDIEVEEDSKKYFSNYIDKLFINSEVPAFYWPNGDYMFKGTFIYSIYNMFMKSINHGLYYPVLTATGDIQDCFDELFRCIDEANEKFDKIDEDKFPLDKHKLKADFLRAKTHRIVEGAEEAFLDLINYCCSQMENGQKI